MSYRRTKPDPYVGIKLVTIRDAEQKRSRHGHNMIVLRLSVPGAWGRVVREWLPFTRAAAWKLEQFFCAIGKCVADGEVINARDLVQQKGYAEIGVKLDWNNPPRKHYYVVKWLRPKAVLVSASVPTENGALITPGVDTSNGTSL